MHDEEETIEVMIVALLKMLPRGLNPIACGRWYEGGGVPVELDGEVVGATLAVVYDPTPRASYRAVVERVAVADLLVKAAGRPLDASAVQGMTWPGPPVLRLLLGDSGGPRWDK